MDGLLFFEYLYKEICNENLSLNSISFSDFLFIHMFLTNYQFSTTGILMGEWNGTGSGFGNESSTVETFFKSVMNDRYIEFKNESWFEPTSNTPERDLIFIRQFQVEGYINQYILADSLSNDTMQVFESESIENFVPGGKARWTIKKISDNQIETIFDVAFPNSDYSCMGEINSRNNGQRKSI